ncbi:MAG: hypothetical protein EA369_08670 [Bradymonadales bacterium]|nr:MAG: hypothetical protein EA369_08670 [Bradymonadales bacterium]
MLSSGHPSTQRLLASGLRLLLSVFLLGLLSQQTLALSCRESIERIHKQFQAQKQLSIQDYQGWSTEWKSLYDRKRKEGPETGETEMDFLRELTQRDPGFHFYWSRIKRVYEGLGLQHRHYLIDEYFDYRIRFLAQIEAFSKTFPRFVQILAERPYDLDDSQLQAFFEFMLWLKASPPADQAAFPIVLDSSAIGLSREDRRPRNEIIRERRRFLAAQLLGTGASPEWPVSILAGAALAIGNQSIRQQRALNPISAHPLYEQSISNEDLRFIRRLASFFQEQGVGNQSRPEKSWRLAEYLATNSGIFVTQDGDFFNALLRATGGNYDTLMGLGELGAVSTEHGVELKLSAGAELVYLLDGKEQRRRILQVRVTDSSNPDRRFQAHILHLNLKGQLHSPTETPSLDLAVGP